MWTVMIRWNGDRRAQRLCPDGTTTTRRIHAAMIDDEDKARRIAAKLVATDSRIGYAWAERF